MFVDIIFDFYWFLVCKILFWENLGKVWGRFGEALGKYGGVLG
jgi:hypothetical protein